jgi:hypothetical protein
MTKLTTKQRQQVNDAIRRGETVTKDNFRSFITE